MFQKGNTIRVGTHLSEEHKKKLSASLKGRIHSPETVEKMRLAKTGVKHSERTKFKMSLAKRGRAPYVMTDAIRQRMSEAQKGIKRVITPEQRARFGIKTRFTAGSQHPNWKGGTTPEFKKIRNSTEYKIWRKAVFERDGYMCVIGGKSHGNKLQADHIKPFAYFPELRFEVSNGRTLCVPCHKETPTFGINGVRHHEALRKHL